MSVNAFAPLTISPIVVYSILALYGIVITAVALFVYRKFAGASMLLSSLRTDWASAEASHKSLIDVAKDHVSRLATSGPAASKPEPFLTGARSVTFDTRNQIVAMAKKGFNSVDIARACAMPEADVDVLLGMARIQR